MCSADRDTPTPIVVLSINSGDSSAIPNSNGGGRRRPNGRTPDAASGGVDAKTLTDTAKEILQPSKPVLADATKVSSPAAGSLDLR